MSSGTRIADGLVLDLPLKGNTRTLQIRPPKSHHMHELRRRSPVPRCAVSIHLPRNGTSARFAARRYEPKQRGERRCFTEALVLQHVAPLGPSGTGVALLLVGSKSPTAHRPSPLQENGTMRNR